MEPVPFAESNFTFTPPDGMPSCCELPVFRDFAHGVSTSKWRLTKAEIEEVERTGCVFLSVYGSSHPPVTISTTPPW